MSEKLEAIFHSPFTKVLVFYLILVSLVSIYLTVIDKKRAIKQQWRIPEKTLLALGMLGGALPMLLMMKHIRHKTRHSKFMIGLPIEIILHLVLVVILFVKI